MVFILSFQSDSVLEISNKQTKLFLEEENDPFYRFNFLTQVLGFCLDDQEIKVMIEDLSNSKLVNSLFNSFQTNISTKKHPYKKWNGTHWCLSILADLHYPLSNPLLEKAREYEFNWVLSSNHLKNIRTINSKTRFCASQEGNALFSIMRLKLDNGRAKNIKDRLIEYQWEDGGWNCDKREETKNSSYNESLIPLRGLNEYYLQTNDSSVKPAIERATELFLKRQLFKRISDGNIIHPDIINLSYPAYWHYNIIDALKVLGEIKYFKDSRIMDAVQLLLEKQQENNGFPAEKKYYQCNHDDKSLYSSYNWGGANKRKSNPWVTLAVLSMLNKFNLLHIEY